MLFVGCMRVIPQEVIELTTCIFSSKKRCRGLAPLFPSIDLSIRRCGWLRAAWAPGLAGLPRIPFSRSLISIELAPRARWGPIHHLIASIQHLIGRITNSETISRKTALPLSQFLFGIFPQILPPYERAGMKSSVLDLFQVIAKMTSASIVQ